MNIEYYQKPKYAKFRSVFACQFFSTEGLNIGTWIPDTSIGNGVLFQPGPHGRGRIYAGAFRDGRVVGPSENIEWAILRAKVQTLDPGEGRAPAFVAGWRRAQDSLRAGADPAENPAVCDFVSEEYFNGYIGRLAQERRLRSCDVNTAETAQTTDRDLSNHSGGADPIRIRPSCA